MINLSSKSLSMKLLYPRELYFIKFKFSNENMRINNIVRIYFNLELIPVNKDHYYYHYVLLTCVCTVIQTIYSAIY